MRQDGDTVFNIIAVARIFILYGIFMTTGKQHIHLCIQFPRAAKIEALNKEIVGTFFDSRLPHIIGLNVDQVFT